MKASELKRRLARADASQADLADFMSRELGRPVSIKAVSRIVTGERLRLGVEEAAAIEAFFDERGAGGYFPAPAKRAPESDRPKIPLYGFAAAHNSLDGIAYDSEHILDWLDAPLANIDAAFRVGGSSMEPRLFAGETVFVKLGVTPRRGDDAVIEMKDSAQGVLIKTFEKIDKGFVFLRQWNPVAEVKLRYDQVRALHAVRLRS
ncbi:MAG: hypothetical protein BroJett013_30280 [Alphaproteobacteria bacterium]|nr:MAG: hypothetical protein BroJett013_30280 [Alphaproteobacteria bacterium]